MRVKTALVTLCLLVVAGIGSGPAAASIPSGFAGVLVDGPSLDGSVDFAEQTRAMRANRVSWVRLPVDWAQVEPQDGEYYFGKLDSMIAAAAASGLDVMPVVKHAPYWASVPPAAVNAPPKNPAEYGSFMKKLAARYGTDGTFWSTPGVTYRPVKKWQVWNEPDMPYAWRRDRGTTWQAGYVRVLRSARSGILEADPKATVVLGGLSNYSWRSLRLLYKAGARRLFDVAALHPFSKRVSGVVEIATLSRQEMKRWGDGSKPLILGEVSWSSSNGKAVGLSTGKPFSWDTSESGQARRVAEVIRALAAKRKSLRIESFAWATWLSPAPGSRYWFDYTGLNRLRGERVVGKPALKAYRDTVRRLGGR